MALSDAWSDNLTRLLLGRSTAPAVPTPYLAIYTVLPAPDGTGGTEVNPATYGFGARVHVAGDTFCDDPSGGDGLPTLEVDVGFGPPAADPGPVVGCALTNGAAGELLTEAVAFDDPIDVVI